MNQLVEWHYGGNPQTQVRFLYWLLKIKDMKETILYGLGFIFVVFMSLGLFGAFDRDKGNPFKLN